MRADIPIISFKSQKEFEKWLSKNHKISDGIWIRFYKKGSGIESLNYAQALDEALCYGWIDAIVKKYDEASYIQYFTPRRSKSIWSKRNIEHIERLTKLGKMREAGIAQYEAAKADGRLAKAYDSASTMKIHFSFFVF